jgi:hypothetical protein
MQRAPQDRAALAPSNGSRGVSDADIDIITILEVQRLDRGGGKTDRKAIALFGDLHGPLHH